MSVLDELVELIEEASGIVIPERDLDRLRGTVKGRALARGFGNVELAKLDELVRVGLAGGQDYCKAEDAEKSDHGDGDQANGKGTVVHHSTSMSCATVVSR